MTIPKYVTEMLEGSEYNYDYATTKKPNYATGYTFDISKRTWRQHVDTFRADLERMKKWVEKNGGEMHILYAPCITRHAQQYAIVTVYDPVMKHIEHLIK